jgi:hypothetical protein
MPGKCICYEALRSLRNFYCSSLEIIFLRDYKSVFSEFFLEQLGPIRLIGHTDPDIFLKDYC